MIQQGVTRAPAGPWARLAALVAALALAAEGVLAYLQQRATRHRSPGGPHRPGTVPVGQQLASLRTPVIGGTP